MARIYNPEQYGDNFQGSIQSRGFNPVSAIDRSKHERKKAQEAVDNINREIQILDRDQQMERTFQSSVQGVERANLQATSTAVTGLLSLSQTALKARKVQIEQKEVIEKENLYLDSIGFDQEDEGLKESDSQAAKDLDTSINAEATAINQTAEEVESNGTLEDRDVGNQLRQGSAYNIAAGIKGNVYEARASHGIYMQEALRLIPDDQKPRSLPEAKALLRSLNRQFFKTSGLFEVNRSLVASELAPTILEHNKQLAIQLVGNSHKADQAANLTQLKSTIHSAAASNKSAAEVWKLASEGTAHGNIGHSGFSAASNETAIKLAIQAGLDSRDPELLEQLKLTPKMADQPNGPTLGDEFAHLLDPAISQARDKRTQAINSQRQATDQEAKAAVTAYYSDPTKKDARQTLIRQLQGLPQTTAVRRELDSLMSAGFNNDPELEADIARRQAAGEFISQDELNGYLRDGRIRPEVHKAAAARNPDIQLTIKARELVKEQQNMIQSRILGNNKMSNMPKATRAAFDHRVLIASAQIAKQFAAEARSAKEGLLDNPEEYGRVLSVAMDAVLARPEFQMSTDPVDGMRFLADLGTERTQQFEDITMAPGEQDFRGKDFTKLTTKVPRSEFSATDDLILDADQLNTDVNNLLQKKEISPSSSKWARWLGLSDRAFIDAQLERNGKPSIRLLKDQSPKAVEPGADLTPVSGFKYLRDLGFSRRGCAYLTSAITHESAWNGMREWGQVEGDGTNRNGGLISWASWHNNAARLGAIEAHFGRSIGSITETEQLEYMQLEMENDYPEADAIFRNPNASSADLQWAVNKYWGFDPKYTDDRWVDAENMINAQ